MDLISQVVFERLWEMASSKHHVTETGFQKRSGTLGYDQLGSTWGDTDHVEKALDRLAFLGYGRFWYIKPPQRPAFISYELRNEPKPLTSYTLLGWQRTQWGTTETKAAPVPENSSGYVYIIKGKAGHYKIGKTTDPDVRIKNLGVVLPFKIKPIHIIECQNRHEAETTLHHRYWHRRIAGEWYKLTAEDLNEIKAIQEM